MKLRLFLAASLIALLGGCVSLGNNTGLLFTPFGVIGAHSFAPPQPQRDAIPWPTAQISRRTRRYLNKALFTSALLAISVVLQLSSISLAHATNIAPWAPRGISSPQFESHAAFDPRNGDLYFVRSSPQFEGWRILVSRCSKQGWSEPAAPEFAGDGVEADPWFTSDGSSLYFISTRSTDGVKRKDLDIWRVDRSAEGRWGSPTRLPEPVNSTGQEWFPRLAADGWLYFGSSRPGGLGKTDIWRARADAQGRWTASNLGPAINTEGDEYEPLVSPDGSSMIVMADGGLYESRPRRCWMDQAREASSGDQRQRD